MRYLIEIDLLPPHSVFPLSGRLSFSRVATNGKGKTAIHKAKALEKRKRHICKKNCILRIRTAPN
jgi:hypothetical protein